MARLGQWELLERLATSRSGERWLARDAEAPGAAPIALKLVDPDLTRHQSFVEAFLEEARLAVKLDHPGLVQVLDVCFVDETYVVATELVVGEGLDAVLSALRAGSAPVPVEVAARIISDACEALHHAHTATGSHGEPLNLSHRGLHPSNLLVAWDGRVKVADLGLSAALTRVPDVRNAVEPLRYAYVSPEQCLDVPLDARSDAFALGVLLWELLTARRLFDGTTELAIKQGVVNRLPQPPSDLREDVPPDLDRVVLRALAKSPAERFDDTHAMHLALESVIQAIGRPADTGSVRHFLQDLLPERQQGWQRRLGPAQPRTRPGSNSLLAPDAATRKPPTTRPVQLGSAPSTVPARRRGDGRPVRRDTVVGMLAAVAAAVEESDRDAPATRPTTRRRPQPERSAGAPPPSRPRAPADLPPAPVTRPVDGRVPSPAQMAHAAREAAAHDRHHDLEPFDGAALLAAEEPRPLSRRGPPPAPAPPEPPALRPPEVTGPVDLPPPDGLQPPPDGFEPDPFVEPEPEPEPWRHTFDLEAALGMPGAHLPTRLVGQATTGRPVVDIVRFRGDTVLDAASLHRYRRRWGRPGVSPLWAKMDRGDCRIGVGRAARGRLHRKGAHADVFEDVQPLTTFYLHEGDRARIQVGDDTFVIRLYPAPLSPLPRGIRLPLGGLAIALVLAVVAHALGAWGIHALDRAGVRVRLDPQEQVEQFADVRLQKVKTLRKKPRTPTVKERAKDKRIVRKDEPKKPSPKPLAERKPPPPPEPVTLPPTPEELQPRDAELTPAMKRRLGEKVAQRTAGKTQSERVADMFKTPTPGVGTTMKEAVTTIQAEQAKGASSAPRVGGTLDDLGGKEVSLGLGGGGEPGTISGPKATEKVARLEERKKPQKVRGLVRGMKTMAKVSGKLERAAVLQEIGRHHHAVLRCYERELMHTAGLSGKITFSWQIRADGRVSGARQQTSTLGSNKVSTCILGVIRRMRFPKPTGGSVQVVYPFIFRSAS